MFYFSSGSKDDNDCAHNLKQHEKAQHDEEASRHQKESSYAPFISYTAAWLL
jgi:hypothetical protein